MRLGKSVLLMVVVLNAIWVGAARAQIVCTLGVGPVQQYNPGWDMAPSPRAASELISPWRKSPLHSTGVASRLTASFVGCIYPICALLTPCQPGATPVSVRRGVSPRAVMQIYNLLCSSSPYGCGTYFLFSNPTVPNAMAMAVGPGQTKITYSADFMNSIAGEYGGGATFGILAHEFGHHLDIHLTPSWMNTSWSRELKADAWAGCALARAGVDTTAIENALTAIAAYPSPSHPDWPLRRQAVRTGFANCGGQWLQSFDRY